MFVKNTWYVAAMPNEIKTGKSLARQICGISMVFFYDENNQVVALENFCPHRGASLSLGTVEEGGIVCGYHGLKVGCDGAPISMENQDPKKIPCIKAFGAIEKYGFIWVYAGDKKLADTALIPKCDWADDEQWAYGGGFFHIKCNYKLMIDNLMDLTHEKYVHLSTIGQEEIDESAVSTQVEDGQITTSRYMNSIIAPAFWQMCMKKNNLDPMVKVDRWQCSRFVAPCGVLIDVGVAYEGEGGINAPKDKRVKCIVVDFMTPESEDTMWYFWGMARNFEPHDEELTQSIYEGQGVIFSEDLEVLEEQHKNHKLFPDKSIISLDIDTGGKLARREITRMLKEENA